MFEALEKRFILPYVTFTETEAIGHPPQLLASPTGHNARMKPGMPIHYCPFCGFKLADPAYVHKQLSEFEARKRA